MRSNSNSKLSKSPQKSNVWSIPQDKLKIIIRIRPVLNQQQQIQFVQLQDHNTLQIKRPGNFTYMKFNNILPYYSTQKDVFNLLEESVNQFLQGTNITVFAYGQTGAGKTYSIIGNYSNQNEENIYHLLASEERGILSRSLEMIMQSISNQPGARIFISFYQIYNQKILDLYNKQGSGPLQIRQSKNGQISIPNLISIQITHIQQAIHYLMIGLKNRSTGSTHANAKSSRSHSIFQISLQKDNQLVSLRIVDLAGSQKFKIPSDITAAEKQIRIQQLTSINGSLSCLGHCISALIQKSRTHIPFRNSKLTRILSDSLLGQGKMRFIICISPSISASAETFSTLQFANRAKRAIFNRSESKTPQMSKKKSETQEMLILRKEIQKQRQLRLAYEEQLGETKKQNVFLKIENQRLIQKIKQIMNKFNNNTQCHNNANNNKSKSTQKLRKLQNNNNNVDNFQNYQQNSQKQNDLHGQMLSLPIFQKNRNISNTTNNNNSQFQLLNQNNNNKPINLKKAQFQKKIRKFIEQNSPQQKKRKNNDSQNMNIDNMSINLKNENINLRNSFIQNTNRNIQSSDPNGLQKLKDILQISQHQPNPIKKPPHQFQQPHNRKQSSHQLKPQSQGQNQQISQIDDSLWQYHEQQTQQFFQKACQKMNMKQYQDLKQQMEKAKSELLKFKLKDNQLEKKSKITQYNVR